MRRFAFAFAVVTMLSAANCCVAQETVDDQKIAQSIVEALREHQDAGRLKGFDIDLNVEGGRVTLTGNVADEQQHDLAIDAARFAPGAKLVVNNLKIKGETRAHPEQQKTLTGNLAAMFGQQRQPSSNDSTGLLTGLRNAWSKPSADQTAAQPVADAQPPAGSSASQAVSTASAALPVAASGQQIDTMVNPDPLLQNDPHVARGYSAFGGSPANKPVATISQVSGAGQLRSAQPEAIEPTESIVAAPASEQAQSQLSRWEPRVMDQEATEKPQLVQAVANGESQTAQLASNNVALPQPTVQQPQQAQPQPQQVQAAPQQVQAVQVIHVPVPMYPQMQQQPQRVPVAYAASRLPGGQQMPMQQIRMAQAMQPQRVQPAPQFVQGTGGGVVPARYDHPHMPGYAWPSYASYPNYSALQYPKQYSAHAWPYIGPFYPYPQVPLGWRKVTLSWDDGWWHLDFKDRGYGPYVTR